MQSKTVESEHKKPLDESNPQNVRGMIIEFKKIINKPTRQSADCYNNNAACKLLSCD